MSQLSLKTEFLEILDQLPEEAQDRVVDLVRCLAAKSEPVPGSRLSALHGILDDYGIANSFEIYSGTHTSALADRIQNHVIPFFSRSLKFAN